MREVRKIPTLTDYNDLFLKAQCDFEQYKRTSGVYELANCLLTLNALPEWILNCDKISVELKKATLEKLNVMKNMNNLYPLDEKALETDIDQKLRFVRLFCNHLKHSEPKEKFPAIEMGAPIPTKLPAPFTKIKIGERYFDAPSIVQSIIDFWDGLLNETEA